MEEKRPCANCGGPGCQTCHFAGFVIVFPSIPPIIDLEVLQALPSHTVNALREALQEDDVHWVLR